MSVSTQSYWGLFPEQSSIKNEKMMLLQVEFEQIAKVNKQTETFVCSSFKKYYKQLVKQKNRASEVIMKMKKRKKEELYK